MLNQTPIMMIFRRFFVFIFSLLVLVVCGRSQQNPLSGYLTLGIASPALDDGYGFQLAANPNYKLTPYISLEAQFSYLYSVITSSFISGNSGRESEQQALLGSRIYVNPNGKFIWSVNALGGAFLNREMNDGWSPGIAFGAFVERQSFLLGISAESSAFFMVKLGYHLR